MELDRTGTFRCKAFDTGVSKTKKGGFVRFTATLHLTQSYDFENETWETWQEYEMEIPLYAVLFGKGKKSEKLEATLNHTQVCEIFGWDGRDFTYLNDTDFSDIEFQVRIEDNDPAYADKNPYQVKFIDVYDAVPGGGIKKLDAEGIKALNAEFAALLKNTGKAAAPATKKPTTAPKVPAKGKKDNKKQTEVVKEKKTTEPPKVPSTPPTVPTVPEESVDYKAEKCTKAQAWEQVVEHKNEACDDDQLNNAWKGAVIEVAPKTAETDITEEQWFAIKDKTLDQVGTF